MRLIICLKLLTILFSVLTTRVSLMALVFLSLLIPFFLRAFRFPLNGYWRFWKKSSVIIVFVIAFFLPIVYQIPIMDGIRQDVLNHFDRNEDIRFEQRKVLLENWIEAPVFGKGFGSKFYTAGKGGLQSEFESTYHLDLATTGVLGLGLFFLYISIILCNTYKRAICGRDPYCMAVLFSLLCLLIASFTNPALASFDRLLPIYLCVGSFADRKRYISRYASE